MKVQDLIKELEKMPKDAEVYHGCNSGSSKVWGAEFIKDGIHEEGEVVLNGSYD